MCPKMTCDVYDLVFFEGLSQPHIGTFALELGRTAQKNLTRAEMVYKEMLGINSKLIDLQNQLETRQNLGEEISVLNLVNEMVSPRRSTRKGARKEKNTKKKTQRNKHEEMQGQGTSIPNQPLLTGRTNGQQPSHRALVVVMH